MSDWMFDEVGVDGKPNTYKKGDWKSYAVHSDTEIKGFFGPYRWLSNFHPCEVHYGFAAYVSSENAYQAAKIYPDDREPFQVCEPYVSKNLWKDDRFRKIYTPEQWDSIKYSVMFNILVSKFLLNNDLRKKLLETGKKELVELNHWGDTFWGVDIRKGGQNNLGKILMYLRESMKHVPENGLTPL
jgi:ribA/ribD-fused uncharacterized protein